MLIEYNIMLQGSGIRVSQHVSPDGSVQPSAVITKGQSHNQSAVADSGKNTPALSAGDTGEKHLDTAFAQPLAAAPARSGSGDPPPTKVGGGLTSVSTLVICFGPVIINGSRSAVDGGGDPPPTKVGG